MKRENLFRDPKVILLAILIVAVVAVNLRQWGPTDGVHPAATEKNTRHSRGAVDREPILLFNELQDDKSIFEHEKRNIFTFRGQSATSETPTEDQTEMAESTPPPAVCGNNICESGEDPTNCPTDCIPPPPPPPVINLRYIGYMSDPQGSVAFLTDGKEVYMARVNDVIANQYRVLKITEDQIEVGLLSNNQSSTIRFQGSQGG
jgi:hypothetical protein